jgi:hypothetical protein
VSKMESLNPLVGRWSTTITMLHPAEVKDEVYHAVDTYRWLPGGRILVHEVEAKMGKASVTSLEIYSARDDGVVSRNFDSGGEVSDYRARMADGVWRVEGDSERFTSTSIAPDAIEGLWELKEDGEWVDWMTVRLDRVS